MKMILSGKADDGATFPFIVPVTPPTTAGYYTNFDLQLIVGDDLDEDPIVISFGRSLDDAKQRRVQSSGNSEISNMAGIVLFQTNLMLSDLTGHLDGANSEFKVYHFHSKKKLYVKGQYSLMEFRIEGVVPGALKLHSWILTADYVPFKNSKFIGRKQITGLLSNEIQEGQGFIVPFDLKNPKVKVTAKIWNTTALDYNLNDIFLIVVPENYRSTYVTNSTVKGESLIKARESGMMTYGSNYALHIPVSSESSGLTVGSKYLNTKLKAGDRLYVVYDEVSESATASALVVDVEVEGQVIYDGRIQYVRAQFRDGSAIVPSDLISLIEKSVGGGF